MNRLNRRSFFAWIPAGLAHLPIIGAWLAKRDDRSIELSLLISRHQAAQYANGYRIIRWIPVAERLPELDRIAYRDGRYGFSRDVLAICRNVRRIGSEDGESSYTSPRDAVGMGHRWREGSTGKILWIVYCDDNCCFDRDVTHWAELPSPPASKLEPVGQDVDGTLKPINELSYGEIKPDGPIQSVGWSPRSSS